MKRHFIFFSIICINNRILFESISHLTFKLFKNYISVINTEKKEITKGYKRSELELEHSSVES